VIDALADGIEDRGVVEERQVCVEDRRFLVAGRTGRKVTGFADLTAYRLACNLEPFPFFGRRPDRLLHSLGRCPYEVSRRADGNARCAGQGTRPAGLTGRRPVVAV